MATFSQIITTVVGLITVGTVLGNIISGLSPETKQLLLLIALGAVAYGVSFGLFRGVRWFGARAVSRAEDQANESAVLLYPLFIDLQSLAWTLERLIQGQGQDSLYALFAFLNPSQTISNLYMQTMYTSSQPIFARIRGLRFNSIQERDLVEGANDLLRLADSYGQFLDDYQREVHAETEDNRRRLRMCFEGYNQFIRNFRVFLQALERTLGSKVFQARWIETRLPVQ